MSGLIWAGIGKGISDAGAAYGSAMMKSADAADQDRREALREQRLLERQEALDELRAARARKTEEELQQRVIKESGQVATRAEEIGAQRQSKAFDKLAASSAAAGVDGDIEVPKETLRKFAEQNPEIGEQYKSMGLVESSMPLTRSQALLQRADDEMQASLDIGAHSSVQKAMLDKRAKVLEQIRLETVEKKNEQQFRATMEAIGQRRERDDARTPILQEKAAAGTIRAGAAATQARAVETRANRPPASPGRVSGSDPNKPATTADLQRQITAAQNILATELGVPRNDVNAAVASVNRKANAGDQKAQETLKRIQPFLNEYSSASQRMLDFKRTPSGASGGSAGNDPLGLRATPAAGR
jgi:hypothetical protein